MEENRDRQGNARGCTAAGPLLTACLPLTRSPSTGALVLFPQDPNFDMRRMEQDVAVQAVAPLRDAATQSTGTVPPRPAVTQTEPLDLPPEAKQDLVRRPRNAPGSVADFLERVRDQ